MALDSKLQAALKQAQDGIVLVIRDLQKRPDFSKQPDLQADVSCFSSYHQALLDAQAQSSLSSDAHSKLRTQGQTVVLPAIINRINANIAISQMGQLNPSRTIPPTMALANNKNLGAEQTSIQSLDALLNASASDPHPSDKPTPDTHDTPTPTKPDDPDKTDDATPNGPDILPEDEVISRFSRWAESLGGEDMDAS
jgi:hypothetical protein